MILEGEKSVNKKSDGNQEETKDEKSRGNITSYYKPSVQIWNRGILERGV